MSSLFWISDSFRKHLAMKVHDLATDVYKVALVTSALVCPETVWTSGAKTVGQVVVPTVRNGHRYLVTVGGSDTTEPSWPTTADDTVGSAPQYTEYGGDLCAHDIWADVSGAEVAAGDGYTTGGVALASKTLTQVYRSTVWDAADPEWSALTKDFRYAFFYQVGTNNGVVNGIVGYALCDDTFVDKEIVGSDYLLRLNASGIVSLTKD